MLKKLKTWIFRKKIKAVIFDYDGVLNDSLHVLRSVWNEFYNRGISTRYFDTDEEFSNYFFGDPVKNLLMAGVKEENLDKCDQIIKEVLPERDKSVEFYPGMDDLIRGFKSQGYKIGIVSNSLKEIVDYKLKKYSIDDCVDSIVCNNDVENPKPSPEGLLKCMAELKVKPSRTFYVGDMESDVKAAKAANVKIIAARYGYLNLAKDMDRRLKDADYFADDVEDIEIIINYFSKNA